MKNNCQQFELSDELSRYLLGTGDNTGLNMIKTIVSARARGNVLHLDGSSEKIILVKRFLEILAKRITNEPDVDNYEMQRIFTHICTDQTKPVQDNLADFCEIITTSSGKKVRAKTVAQQDYINSVNQNHVTVAAGPAGTGKTYLATALAVKYLKDKRVSRIILSKPVIEAGESLGYLPGDIKEKVDPHFKPLYDSLQEFLGLSRFEQMLRQGIIEITPLAYMRGRTFHESLVVVDEAQNTTLGQIKMVLTRIGSGSKVVITGDETQIDLPEPSQSSLLMLKKIIGEVQSVKFVDLTDKDVIRHEIVSRIIKAFEFYKQKDKR